MNGTESVQVQNTYPAPLIAAVLDDNYSNFAACSPLASTPDGPIPGTVLHQGISGWADAYNNEMNGSGNFSSMYTYDVNQSYGSPNTGLLKGSVTTTLSGQLFYYFKEVWQGQGAPTTPMPDHIDLLLKTTVTATADVGYNASTQTSGLSASATASDGSPFNETASASAGDAGGSSGVPSVVGYHLVKASVDSGTGIAEVYVNGTGTAAASNTVAYGTFSAESSIEDRPTNGSTTASATSGVVAVVKPDSREVAISCPTIETSYYKANVDAQHPDGQWSHVPDPTSGAMSGDSVVVYTAGQNAVSVNEYGDAFNALCSGFTHPYYTWSFTGSNGTVGAFSQQYLNAESDQYNSLPLNVNFGSDFSGYPKSGTVKVSVRDGRDNATAANTYDVTWHLPYEAYSYLGQTGSGKHVEKTLASGVYPSASYDLPATDAEDFDVSAAFDAGEAITAAAGQEEVAGLFKVAASIAKLTNLKFSYNGDKASLGNRNDGTSWSVAQGDNSDAYGGGNVSPSSLASNSTGWQLCKLSWCVMSKWHENSWHTDKYTIHGYDSSGHLLVVHTTDTVDEEPYFVQYQNPDGTPVSGA